MIHERIRSGTMKQSLSNDIIRGIAFSMVLHATYIAYVLLFAGHGLASVYWAVALLVLMIAVSVFFGTRISRLSVCLMAVAVLWGPVTASDFVRLRLNDHEFGELTRDASVVWGLHCFLQVIVWTIAKRRSLRRRRVGKQLGHDGKEGRGASGEGVTAESPVTLY